MVFEKTLLNRERVLKGKIAERIDELLRVCAEMNDWRIEELNVQVDHIHMIVWLKPSVSVSRAAQLFKGGKSIVIRKEFPELEEFLWGESFWANGYFVETVGVVNEARDRGYIKINNQINSDPISAEVPAL